MNNVSLKSIKYESIKAIFSAVVNSDGIRRSEISELTGLSLVTVGKITDALHEQGIIFQDKPASDHVGRRASVININESKFAIIIDLTSYDFSCSLLNLRMNPMHKLEYTYKTSASYRENFGVFLGEIQKYLQKSGRYNNCIGFGISVPGTYDKTAGKATYANIPELSTIDLRAEIETVFSDKLVVINSQTNSAAKFNIDSLANKQDKSILYWYLSKEYIGGAFSVDGNLISGKNSGYCDFGSMLVYEDLTLLDKIKFVKNQKECCEAILPTMHNVIKILNPHIVIMELDTNYPVDGILSDINNKLAMKYRIKSDQMPEFIYALTGHNSSYSGLALELRELWIDNIVFS